MGSDVGLVVSLLVSAATGEGMYRLAVSRQRRGAPPYDRPDFPPPALWGLVGWLATPLGVAVQFWRFGLRRWILPILALWGLLVSLTA